MTVRGRKEGRKGRGKGKGKDGEEKGGRETSGGETSGGETSGGEASGGEETTCIGADIKKCVIPHLHKLNQYPSPYVVNSKLKLIK
jgi:hypothetical protein